MRPAVVCILLLLVPAVPADDLAPREESRAYVANTDGVFTACNPAGREESVGGVCFRLDGSETTATLEVHDEVGERTPAVLHRIVRSGLVFVVETTFCDATTVDVSGYDEVRVLFAAGDRTDRCDGEGVPATTGTVDAVFERGHDVDPDPTGLAVSGASSDCTLAATGGAAPGALGCSVSHAGTADVTACDAATCTVEATLAVEGSAEPEGQLRLSASLWSYYPAWSTTTITGVCSDSRDLADAAACDGTGSLLVAVQAGGCQDVQLTSSLRSTLAAGVDATNATTQQALRLCRDAAGVPTLSAV